MAYYLTIHTNNDFKKIDLSLLERFKRLSNFKDSSMSLEEIDCCTSLFQDEVELKKELYINGLISFDDITKELSIRRLYRGKLEKVSYGLIYNDQKKYLDLDYLRSILLSLQNDREFLNKLVLKYRNSYSNAICVEQISHHLICGNNGGTNLYVVLNKFYQNEIFKNNYETGEVTLKYKSLHDLAMFIYSYINSKKNDVLGISQSMQKNDMKKRLLELQKSIVLPGKVKVKKKALKRTEVEGQISLFDEL